MTKRLSPKTGKLIVAGSLVIWVVLMIAGYLIGWDLATKNKIIAGFVGVLLAGGLWVVLCWTFALTLRAQLRKRGYDISPRTRRS